MGLTILIFSPLNMYRQNEWRIEIQLTGFLSCFYCFQVAFVKAFMITRILPHLKMEASYHNPHFLKLELQMPLGLPW